MIIRGFFVSSTAYEIIPYVPLKSDVLCTSDEFESIRG